MKTIKATFRNGASHPAEPVDLPEGASVEVLASDSTSAELPTSPGPAPAAAGTGLCGWLTLQEADDWIRANEEEFG